jgi:hypothetical protein
MGRLAAHWNSLKTKSVCIEMSKTPLCVGRCGSESFVRQPPTPFAEKWLFATAILTIVFALFASER